MKDSEYYGVDNIQPIKAKLVDYKRKKEKKKIKKKSRRMRAKRRKKMD